VVDCFAPTSGQASVMVNLLEFSRGTSCNIDTLVISEQFCKVKVD
jgi:hypothetical protein